MLKKIKTSPLEIAYEEKGASDAQQGAESGEDFVLPVDSPDKEHAVASTMSNAISFWTKTNGAKVLPVTFCCVKIEERK